MHCAETLVFLKDYLITHTVYRCYNQFSKTCNRENSGLLLHCNYRIFPFCGYQCSLISLHVASLTLILGYHFIDCSACTNKEPLSDTPCIHNFIWQFLSELYHEVEISGPSNPLSAGGKHSLTCTVTSDLPPSVQWLDSSDDEVDGSDASLKMGETVIEGNITTLILHFDPIRTSHGGTYTCKSTISELSSEKTALRNVTVLSKYCRGTTDRFIPSSLQ